MNSTQNSKIQSRLLPSKKPDDKRFVKWAEWTWYWQQNKSKQEKRQWDFMFVGWVRSNWPEIAVLKALIWSSPDFVLRHTIQISKEMVGPRYILNFALKYWQNYRKTLGNKKKRWFMGIIKMYIIIHPDWSKLESV